MSAPKTAASRLARLAARVAAVGAIALACAAGLPAPALADSVTCGDLVLTADDEGRELASGTDYVYENNVLTIKTTDPVTVSMAGDGATPTANRIVVDPGEKDDDTDNVAHVTIDGVNIDVSATDYVAAMLVSSGALELELAGDSSLKSGRYCAGLQNGEDPLTISGAGALEATGGWDGAGIGGGQRVAGSNITILGGTVAATGGENGAGIGGGYDGAGSNIIIGGGTVTAKGGDYAAGIGGGSRSSGSNICIDGGLLEVAGGTGADVIGSGNYGPPASDVSITSGCFADADAVRANAPDATSRGKVYGVAVSDASEGGDGYAVIENPDGETADKYPVAVVPAKVQTAALSLADAGAGFTYDGAAIEDDAFDAGGNTVSGLEHRVADAADDAPWEDGLPTDAGAWLVRATVNFTKSGYVAGDELFYFEGNDLTNDVEVTIGRAPLTVRALPQQVVFGAGLPEIATPAYGTHYVIEGFVGDETAETPGAWSGAPEVGFDGQYEQGATPAGSVLAGAVTVSAGSLSSANYEFASFSPADLTVLQSATDPGVDECVETDYTYGDVIVVAGAVAATGDAAGDGVAATSLAAPAPGEVALLWRAADGSEVQLGDPVTPAGDGSYELSYDTSERVVPVGEQTLLVRFAGTGDMADAVQELTVTIGRAALTPQIEGAATKPYDGTTAYLGEDARVTLSGVAGSDDPLGTYALDFEHEGAGAQRLIASNVTLAEGEDAWYELVATTVEGENAGGGIVKAAQQAPAGATGEGEKVAGGDDGSITGVVPGPGGASWRPAGSGDDAWRPVPEGGTVEGLAPGDYEVRQEGDKNHEASDAATVTVPSFSDEHGGISYPDGTAEGEGGLPVLPEGGGTVTWPDGTGAELPGGTAVDPGAGVATTPGGTSVATGEGGALDVTFPGGSQVTVPSGSTVGDGVVGTPDGGTVAPDGEGGLVVTLPDGTEVAAPSGSSVAPGTVVGPDGVRLWPVEDEGPEGDGEPEGEKPDGADKDGGLAWTSDPTAPLAPAALAAAGAAVLLARRRVA